MPPIGYLPTGIPKDSTNADFIATLDKIKSTPNSPSSSMLDLKPRTTAAIANTSTGPVPYQQIETFDDLIGGYTSYAGGAYEKDHGVFTSYPGTTRKFNANPGTNQTMARMAIPMPSDKREKFIADGGFKNKLGDLAQQIITSDGSGSGYIDFLLQSISESFSEKVQISDTIGDNYAAFFFGMAPPTFTFSGQLLNTYQDDWRMAFHLLYQHLLRASKLARYNKMVSLFYDNIIVNGYMLNHSQNFSAEMQMASTFSFNLLVKSISFFRLPKTLPTRSDLLGNLGFKTIAGLQRSAVQSSTRTIGEPSYAESGPSKDGGAGTGGSGGGVQILKAEPTSDLSQVDPADAQYKDNVYNPASATKASTESMKYQPTNQTMANQ
jgi:hypothetical protein